MTVRRRALAGEKSHDTRLAEAPCRNHRLLDPRCQRSPLDVLDIVANKAPQRWWQGRDFALTAISIATDLAVRGRCLGAVVSVAIHVLVMPIQRHHGHSRRILAHTVTRAGKDLDQ